MRRLFLAALTPLCGLACGAPCLGDDPPGVQLRFADTDERLPDFLAHPWPSDARRRVGGRLNLDAFPNPTRSSTLDDYKRVFAEYTAAFGTSAALYLSFTGPIDPARLPAAPAAALDPASRLQLVDVDPASPERGRRYPLLTRYRDEPSLYLPPHHVAALSPFGVPLAPGRTYALLGSELAARDGSPVVASRHLHNALLDGCAEEAPGPLASMMAPLRQYLQDTAADPEEAALNLDVATVFTTADAVGELRRLAAVAKAEAPPALGELSLVEERAAAFIVRGQLELPAYQSGERPYAALGDGGGLAFDEAGRAVRTHYETTRVSLVLPKPTPERPMPPAGWPVVLFSHGTGGDYRDGYDRAVGDVLSALGIAVVGYDQTLHGPRDPTGSDPRLTFFNLFNPLAGRDNVRQGAVDVVSLANWLEAGVAVPAALTGGEPARLDGRTMAFLGHSQGSLVGALAASVEPRFRAYAFSGPGGVLGIALLERKDIVDFAALLTTLLSLPPEDPLDDLHPVIHLIQTFIEPADPVSYARSYLEDPAGGAPLDVLWIEGLLDEASPARGQEAFASAARAPVVEPVARMPLGAELLGVRPVAPPVAENVEGRGGRASFGLLQYPQDTHFPIYENADANARYAEFLRSALYEGRGRIVAPTR